MRIGANDARAVRHPAEHDGAERETEHHQRIGQRGRRAIDAEFGLHFRENNDDGPHSCAGQRPDRKGKRQAGEGVRTVRRIPAGVVVGCDPDHRRTLATRRRAG